MIADLIYRCPECAQFDWYDQGKCRHCHTTIKMPSRECLCVGGYKASIAHWYEKILDFPLPGVRPILKSGKVSRLEEVRIGPYHGFGGIFATRYDRCLREEGRLELWPKHLDFFGNGKTIRLEFSRITSVTIESNTLIIVCRELGTNFFNFHQESGKMWEDCLKKALVRFFLPKRIIEYYPKLRFSGEKWSIPRRFEGYKRFPVARKRYFRSESQNVFGVVRWMIRVFVKSVFSVHIEGLDNIPAQGPAVVVANHGSILDGIILCMFPRRDISFMAKNAPYQNWFLRWFLRHAKSFPVFRYRTDFQVVRNAMRVVGRGDVLGIFPEGERNWDGKMLPFKLGSVRLILALGLPIIPIGISGTYSLMPRWTARLQRVPVRVRIGTPFHLDQVTLPKQTIEDLQDTSEQIRHKIEELLTGDAQADAEFCRHIGAEPE